MKLWLLRPIKPWQPWYDRCFGAVIRSMTEKAARRKMKNNCGDEGSDVWLDDTKTSCEELTADGPTGTIIVDFASA